MRRPWLTEEHDLFRSSARAFVSKEVVPHQKQWESDGIVSRRLFTAAGARGFLGIDAPEEYGGGGVADFGFNAILGEELQRSGSAGAALSLTLHNDICLPYFLELTSADQKARWLPGICRGDLITAIAMTEPSVGSDLASMATVAVQEGDHYVLNGSKTFITNGLNADLVVVAAKTDPGERHRGISLLVIERGMAGFERGRKLDKIGLHSQDTAELFFADVHVPVENRLGKDGEGFRYLMSLLPRERLSIAIASVAAARMTFDVTVEYCRERRAFGQPIGALQNTKFRLAEMKTEIEIAQTFVDRCLQAFNAGELTNAQASMAKWWCTELQSRVVDGCVQLHGGYGYISEYQVARSFVDARVTRIYGGTTEIMKEVIGRSLDL
jgi:alkylation response protein AidB-like acyl-CoA dehydrogenase